MDGWMDGWTHILATVQGHKAPGAHGGSMGHVPPPPKRCVWL